MDKRRTQIVPNVKQKLEDFVEYIAQLQRDHVTYITVESYARNSKQCATGAWKFLEELTNVGLLTSTFNGKKKVYRSLRRSGEIDCQFWAVQVANKRKPGYSHGTPKLKEAKATPENNEIRISKLEEQVVELLVYKQKADNLIKALTAFINQ